MKEGLPFFLTSGRHTVKNGLPLQFFNQAGKVADVAASPLKKSPRSFSVGRHPRRIF